MIEKNFCLVVNAVVNLLGFVRLTMDRSPAVPDRTVHSRERLLEIWSIPKKAVRLGRPFNQPFSTSTSNFIVYSKPGFIKACFWLLSDEGRE